MYELNRIQVIQASDNPHILETNLGILVCKTLFRDGCLGDALTNITETEFEKDFVIE